MLIIYFSVMTDRDKFKTNIQPHLKDLKDLIEAGDLTLELFSKRIITQSSMVEQWNVYFI